MVEEILQILEHFGFPVAVCGVLMWYINEINKRFNEQLTSIMNQHKSETDKMVEAINSNTLVMQKLVDRIGGTND